MGPPPRSSAADAHHCIMVWVFGPPHTRMWHDPSCTQPQLPSDVVIPTTASVPSCSEPSRTRPFGWRYAPSLTAPALDGESISAGGARESPSARVEQEKWTWREKKSRLIDNFVLAFCVAIRERRNALRRGRTKELDQERRQYAVRSCSLNPNRHLCTKAGQAHGCGLTG